MSIDMLGLITVAFRQGASDIHLVKGAPPTLRVAGRLVGLGLPPVTPEDLEETLSFLAQHTNRPEIAQEEVHSREYAFDLSCEIENLGRMRVHIFHEKGSLGVSLRLIASQVPAIAELGIPDTMVELCNRRGLILVTGPVGSGKSTTLAALVRHLLDNRGARVVTIEDPIEYQFPHFRGIVTQKEVGLDCESFHSGLVDALREDPDVIVLGELRDPASADATLTASETGHLVIATMHTPTAARALDRLVDLFPTGRQELARHSLSRALNGVFVQRLLPTRDRTRRVLAYELLVAIPAVRSLIRRGEYHQINSAIESGQQYGMITMAKHIQKLVAQGLVSPEDAFDEVEIGE